MISLPTNCDSIYFYNSNLFGVGDSFFKGLYKIIMCKGELSKWLQDNAVWRFYLTLDLGSWINNQFLRKFTKVQITPNSTICYAMFSLVI
jgi:hypothetical protein